MKNLKEYIEKAKKIHNNFYLYNKTNPKTCKEKCIITCPIHGDFWTTLDNHVNGKTGCPMCKGVKKLTTEEFIKRAKEIHGDKYNYNKTEYKNARTKVCIICHEHGEFWQEPRHHLDGNGCPMCKGVKKLTTEEFIKRAKEIHGDKYDYSKVNYKNAKEKVCIICPEHGEFWQEASSHLSGNGCPKCKGGIVSNTDEFIKKANIIHSSFYDYSKVEYKNAKEKVCIICPKHGEFWQEASSHLSGKGCPKCKSSKLENIMLNFFNKKNINYIYQYRFPELGKKSFDFYLPLYNIVIECQGEQHYIPSKFSYKNDSIEEFNKRIENDILKYNICIKNNMDIIYFTIPTYFRNNININDGFYSDKIVFTHINDVEKFLDERKKKDVKNNFMSLCHDLFNVTQNIIIEDNIIKYKNLGIIYHNIAPNNKDTLISKTNYYNKRNIQVINIFEDEYIYSHDIVLNKIKHIFNIQADNCIQKIPGRKIECNEISNKKAKSFLEKYHIQGFSSSTIYVGGFYNNELIAVMSFKKEKYNNWELTRFASNYNYICQGVGGKLFNYFIKKYSPIEIKSFADRRWTINKDNNLYTKLGFTLDKVLSPDYKYHNINDKSFYRYHKFNFRKKNLHKNYNLPLSMTEKEMTDKLGYYRIWDCGLYKYIWNNKSYQK